MNTAHKLVAGATGKLGRLLIQALLTHPNVRVRALVRDCFRTRKERSSTVTASAIVR